MHLLRSEADRGYTSGLRHACPTDALRFDRDDDPPTVRHPGFPQTGLKPAFRLVGERRQFRTDIRPLRSR